MEDPNQPSFKKIIGYVFLGLAATLITGPMLYTRYMRRSEMDFWSLESFSTFLPFWAGAAVIMILVFIGSHGDPDA